MRIKPVQNAQISARNQQPVPAEFCASARIFRKLDRGGERQIQPVEKRVERARITFSIGLFPLRWSRGILCPPGSDCRAADQRMRSGESLTRNNNSLNEESRKPAGNNNMPRATNAPASRERRKRVLKAAKGYRGRRSKLFRYAKDATMKGKILGLPRSQDPQAQLPHALGAAARMPPSARRVSPTAVLRKV